MRPQSDCAGFSLLELAIVIMLSGLITSAIFAILNQDGQIQSARMNNTMDTLLLGIAEYYRIYGYYPCPADPRIAMDANDPDFGRPVIAGGDCEAAVSSLSTSGIGGGRVIIGAVPVRALNEAMGCTPTDTPLPDNLIQTFQNKLTRAEQMFFGTPADYDSYDDFNKEDAADRAHDTITETSRKCVPDHFIQDIYGSKITYAVNHAATMLHRDPPVGNIEIINRDGQRSTEDLLNFVLVSHGMDRKGAYPANGSTLSALCGPGAALDDENCNNDATFRAMPYSAMNNAYAANHFDDRIEFSLIGYLREKDVWRWSEGATADTRNMIFDAQDNQALTIGVPDSSIHPDEKLGVYGGNIRIDGDLVTSGPTTSPIADVRAGSSVTAIGDIDVDLNAGAPKFCYDPPLTNNCR